MKYANRPLALLVAGALVVTLASCSSSAVSTITASSAAGTVLSATESEFSLEGATAFTFTDSGISAVEGDYNGYTIEGTALTISAAGTYVVSGSCADGSITIKADTENVTLVLNGLELTSTTTAPIVCGKSTGVTIAVQSGTQNTLADTTANNKDNENASADAESAVLKCKDGAQVVLCGGGTLNISAAGKNGIKSGTENEGRKASLTIRELTLNIDAPENDAVNAEQTLNVESGTLNISAGDDALHSDYTLNIGAEDTAGPTITISTCNEGLEGATLNVFSGTIDITATDDCLNAANGDLTDYDFSMNISGGTITAYTSGGDGFDSNGSLTISGGSIAVWTANAADNQPLDADGTITITGGTVLAAGGSAGMGYTIDASQGYVTYGGGMGADSTVRLTKDSAFAITDASGNTVYSGTALCDANYVFYCAQDVTADSDYTLTTGSTTLATATAQTGTSRANFGGMGGGQNGMTPPDGANGQTPPAMNGSAPGGQAPDGQQGGTPPEKPTGTPSGNPPQMPAQNNATSQAETTAAV